MASIPRCVRTMAMTFAAFILSAGLAYGQPAGEPAAQPLAAPDHVDRGTSGVELWNLTQSKLFNGEIHRIYVKMNQATWNQLHDDEKNSGCRKSNDVKWVHARYFVVDDVPMKDVAMKVRGNTSRCIPRLQFSVQFDRDHGVYSRQGNEAWHEVVFDEATKAAIKDRSLFGLTEISLRRSYNDSSSVNDSGNGLLAREYLATWAAGEAENVAHTTVRGAPLYRTVYALVEFQLCASDADNACTNRFRRAYLIAETLDKSFFKMRFDDKKPTVFAMAHGCALKGDNGFGLACVEPQYLEGKKFDEDDAQQKAQALSYLTGPTGLKTRLDAATTPAAIGEVLDLDNVVNYASIATTVGHWDSAYGNFNNDLLYYDHASNKWKLIIWDMDNTFDYNGRGDPFRRYAYDDVAKAPRVLFDKLFALPELNARLKKRLGAYVAQIYDNKGAGPISGKIIEGRDRYIAKLNAELVAGERQKLSRTREMFDYTRTRFGVLRKELAAD